MNASLAIRGDVGEFIIAELGRRGITVPQPGKLPRLSATWSTITPEIESAPGDTGVAVQGCSLTDVAAFCFSLFSGLRQPRLPLSDERFTFSIGGESGHFSQSSAGLTISFGHRVTVMVVAGDGELGILFADLAAASPRPNSAKVRDRIRGAGVREARNARQTGSVAVLL